MEFFKWRKEDPAAAAEKRRMELEQTLGSLTSELDALKVWMGTEARVPADGTRLHELEAQIKTIEGEIEKLDQPRS